MNKMNNGYREESMLGVLFHEAKYTLGDLYPVINSWKVSLERAELFIPCPGLSGRETSLMMTGQVRTQTYNPYVRVTIRPYNTGDEIIMQTEDTRIVQNGSRHFKTTILFSFDLGENKFTRRIPKLVSAYLHCKGYQLDPEDGRGELPQENNIMWDSLQRKFGHGLAIANILGRC